MQTETANALKQIPFFEDISEEALLRLAEHGIKKSYPKNAILINEGDEAGPLFVILDGKVRVYLSSADGKVVVLSTQESGTYFGELSLLDDAPRSASVVTLEPTTCALIGRNAFSSWFSEHPEAALSMIRGLTRRVRVLTESVKGLALSDVYGRLVEKLYSLADEQNGELVVREKLSHQDLANLVGSSREMVSRIMKDLTRGGYVSSENKTICIHRKFPHSW